MSHDPDTWPSADAQHMALSGIRVVDVAQGIAGPYTAKLLADMGAEVIKVEPPLIGNRSRHAGPFPAHHPHPERSGMFLYLNTNKVGIRLNSTVRQVRQYLANSWPKRIFSSKTAHPAG